MAQLAPYPNPLGLFPNYFARQSETLVLKERVLSLSGDSFSIKTVDGRELLQIKGEVVSLSGRKHVMDVAGNNLFDIRKKHIALHTTFYAEDANGNHLFDVKSKFQLIGSKAVCTFTSPAGKAETLVMKGNFLDTSADIVCEATGQPVARIDRKLLNARELLGGQQTYAVTVAPNVDIALIVAMCVCLDEKRNESK